MSGFEEGKTYLGTVDFKVCSNIFYKCIKVTDQKVTFKVKGIWKDEDSSDIKRYQITVPYRQTSPYREKAEDDRYGLTVDSCMEAIL